MKKNNQLITKLNAYAKINIGLNVYKKHKKDNKHKIKSLFLLLNNYFDEIKIYKNQKLEVIYYYKSKKISINDDIITKCMQYLKSNFGLKINYKIVVYKNIPLSSGLGGSSTDGACVLKYFVELYNLKLTKRDMLFIAKNISSDMCFFLKDYQLALVSKFGNKVKEVKINNIPKFKLIFNNYKCDTKKVYEVFDSQNTKQKKFKNNFKLIIKNSLDFNNCIIINELEPVVLNLYPELKQYKKDNRLLSGSGSTFIEWGSNENKN